MTPRFYHPFPLPLINTQFKLPEDMFHHAINVLRLHIGDELIIFDGLGYSSSACLTRIEKKSADAIITQEQNQSLESPLCITLAQCLSVGDKMDWIIEKSVELGVASIVPLFSAKSQVKLTPERAIKKLEHWQRIIIAACAQCGRNVLPHIKAPQQISTFLTQDTSTYKLILHPRGAQAFKKLPPPTAVQDITILVGPESGFDDKEISMAQNAGYASTTLGPRTLRTESAGLTAIAALQAIWGDF